MLMNGVGMATVQRSKKPCMSVAPNRSQIASSARGSSHVANPFARAFVGDAGVVGLVFGPLMSVAPHPGRIGAVRADLDELGTEVRVGDVEVVGPNPAFLLDEIEAGHPFDLRAVLPGEDPSELLGGDDGNHP
jgi:hypothetical protein